ncbi:glutathione S-transferase [Chaetomidium leptoderma]|uniref:Glutathione S-transferase n=1 Tax=Chaetomidium leptoderma TaxID=669021 RepID=A0AAN7A081_9PEZI|nr:glutathione S-transferase [Chaetomidium leptoderma]
MASRANLQPIKLWGRRGPNPPKVTMILEELQLPYKHIPIEFQDVKNPEYLAINPNGRLPAIHDPNANLNPLGVRSASPPGSDEAYHAKQWLFFQSTGQGPYFGQATWFIVYHHEKVPSAFQRYVNEVKRVSGVLEAYLGARKNGGGGGDGHEGPWLVGGKLTYADLSFIPWYCWMEWFLEEEEYSLDEYPVVKDWLDRMRARESVSKVLEDIKPANARK